MFMFDIVLTYGYFAGVRWVGVGWTKSESLQTFYGYMDFSIIVLRFMFLLKYKK